MAKKKRKQRRYYDDELPEFSIPPHVKRGILVIVFLVIGVVTLLSLFDSAGSLGQAIVRILQLLFGWGSVAVPLIAFALAASTILLGREAHGYYDDEDYDEEEEDVPHSNRRVYIGGALFTFSLMGLLHLLAMRDNATAPFELVKQGIGGGYIGVITAAPIFSVAEFWASFAIFLGVIFVSIIVLFNINLGAIFSRARDYDEDDEDYDDEEEGEEKKPVKSGKIKINKMAAAGFSSDEVDEDLDDEEEEGGFEEDGDEEEGLEGEDDESDNEELDEDAEAGDSDDADYTLDDERYSADNWELPSVSLLEKSRDTVDSGDIEANVTIIQKTLADFGIPVEMGEVNVGPTVTQYTLRPTQGIKLSQISALQNDLALALAAPSIRLETPIPGRSLVGIEIPNKATAIVRLKDIVKTDSFKEHKSSLAFSLGRDVAGHAMVGDLAKMPHLLIAGATGTGKSVGINSLMISLLFHNSPEELRMIIIDPKRVELNLYNGIPHLLTPVVTDYEKAVNALKWAVNEMDRRYELLAESGKRNIVEYNRSAGKRLPYVVIIVDELADLMAVAQADVEAAVVRLAQMARAVGIHLVLATQRPSVDIITGLIKANITARIAFAVASQTDSRTILDQSGAEKLLGSGDMLFITAELGKPKRVQGTYVSEKEVKNVVGFIKQQAGKVDYTETILEKQKVANRAAGFEVDDEEDDLLAEAVEEVQRARKASASLLQRRLRIGYARAARLLDLMEERGIVGPADGAKPRDVYVVGDDYQE